MSAVERIMSRRLQGNQKKKYTQTCGRQIERENGRDIWTVSLQVSVI